jgi:hypothetical protein
MKITCKKYSNNIKLNNYDSYINLQMHRNKANNKNQIKKSTKTYTNLNKIKPNNKKLSFNINNNSQKLLISKSNSELGHKNDFGIYTNSTNSSSNLKKNIKSLSKNFSSRNINHCGKSSFDLLKISNDDILSYSKDKHSNSKKDNKNKKSKFSLKNINKLKMFNLIKNKSFLNSCSRKKNSSLIKYNDYKAKKKYKDLYNILPKKNLLKNQKSNFCKYLLDSTNLYIFPNNKENKENIKSNCNSRNKNIIFSKFHIVNNNKTKKNSNKSMYIDFNNKFKRQKNSNKKNNNLPFHPNTNNKVVNRTEANQNLPKFIAYLTENNIPLDKKLLKNKAQLSTKNLMQKRIKNILDTKIINNSYLYELNCFSDKSYIKKKGKINKNNKINIDKKKKKNDIDIIDEFEGVEMGHFRIVKVIQEVKKNQEK